MLPHDGDAAPGKQPLKFIWYSLGLFGEPWQEQWQRCGISNPRFLRTPAGVIPSLFCTASDHGVLRVIKSNILTAYSSPLTPSVQTKRL